MSLTGFWRSAFDPERMMRADVMHWQEDSYLHREDQLTVEEPFEIRIDSKNLAVIMRTPGHDYELAMGFLLTEGIIQSAADVEKIEEALDDDGLPLLNVVNVLLRSRQQQNAYQAHPATFERRFAVSASCGLCGRNSIADLLLSAPILGVDTLRIPASIFYTLSAQLRTRQTVFGHTGGLHAAALFSQTGELLLLREDVGRHNAVDKLVGYGLLRNLYPFGEHILLVSGRSSFEIVQKALLARIPCIAAISAPSSLAVDLADKSGITLIGFLRDETMNVYSHPERVVRQ